MPSTNAPVTSQQSNFWFSLYRHNRYDFYGSGVNSWAHPPAQNPEMFEQLLNVFPGFDVLRRRWGYNLFATPGFDARRLYIYQNETSGGRFIVASGTSGVVIYDETGGGFAGPLFSTAGFSRPARMVNSRSYGFFATPTGAMYKWDGSASGGVTGWGFAAPTTAVSVGVPTGGGAITLNSGRQYFCVFKNSSTGNLSDLNPVSASTGKITAKNVPLTTIPVSTDPQVDKKLLLATLDGGDQTILFLISELPNATTTVTDATTEETLAAANIVAYIDDAGLQHGCVFNTPPPAGMTALVKHKGRLFGLIGQTLAMSKSLDETVTSTGFVAGNYEEDWPPAWQIDISEGAEKGRALMSDGVVLYIGSERSIRTLSGDSLVDWSKPEVVFNDVGVLNQEVWQRVFMEGQPVGSCWLTPDFRCIQSDFNTYLDIGAPIQDLLLTINPAAVANVCAMPVSDGEFDLYVLAFPTGTNTDCDTLAIYNLRTKTWATWSYPDPVVGLLYNVTATGAIQKIIATGGTLKNLWQIDRSYLQDRLGVATVNISSTIRTTWLPLSTQQYRKMLNEMEIITGDPTMLVTIEGANNFADFQNPAQIVTNAPLLPNVFGALKVYLAGKTTKYKFYRFTFISTSTATQVLNGYSLEYVQTQIG